MKTSLTLKKSFVTTLGLVGIVASAGAAQQNSAQIDSDPERKNIPYASALNRNIMFAYPQNVAIVPTFDVNNLVSRGDGCYVLNQFNVPSGGFVLLADATNGELDVQINIPTEDSIVANYRVLRPDSTGDAKPVNILEKIRTNPEDPDSLAKFETVTHRLYVGSLPELIRVIFWKEKKNNAGQLQTIGSYNYWVHPAGYIRRDKFVFGQETRSEYDINMSVGPCELTTSYSRGGDDN